MPSDPSPVRAEPERDAIERAAAAICHEWGYRWDLGGDDEQGVPEDGNVYDERPTRQLYRDAARAALMAAPVRAEPTDEVERIIATLEGLPTADVAARAASMSRRITDAIALLRTLSPVRAERGEAERDALDARRYRFLRDNPLGLRAVDGNAGYPPASAANFDWYVDSEMDWYVDSAMDLTPPATPTEPTDACPDCSRTDRHVHCPECGSTEHVASTCDMMG